jgi:hypothetical protein
MPDQLITSYVESPLVIITINSGSLGVKGCLTRDKNLGNWQKWSQRGDRRGLGNGGRRMRATRFCGPCVGLGVFLLLLWRVFVSGIAGGCK